MNIAALSIDSLVESDITQLSFWKLLDMDATIAGSMKTLKENHNASLPSAKGRIRSPEYTTAKILIYLMAHEMERLRVSKPEIYKVYLSEDCDYLPVSTNRGQLRTMMDEEYSLRSYSNFIDRLLDSQIILRKRNTSRLCEKVMDKHGKLQEVIRLAPNGRGDFILHISKQALTFSPVLFPLQPRQTSSGNDDTIDNQPVTLSQVQNLQQPHSFETIKINNNNSGKVENETASPSHSIVSLRDPLRDSLRNEGIGDEGNRNAELIPSLTDGQQYLETIKINNNNSGKVENETASPSHSIVPLRDPLRNLLRNEGNRNAELIPSLSEGQQYLKKLDFETRLQRRLPKKDKNFYATLLFMQVKRCLYQKYTSEYWKRIEPHAKNLLRLHLQRLEEPIEQAFQTVSRAIQLVKRYLDTHPDAYIYHILTWLRIDGEYISGTLKIVVEEWIPKEEKRLLVYENQRAEFVKWQYAVRYVDKVFFEVVQALRKGFHSGVYECKNGLKRIDSLFEKYELPQSTRTVLRKRYVDRISSITIELNRLGKYSSTPYTNT